MGAVVMNIPNIPDRQDYKHRSSQCRVLFEWRWTLDGGFQVLVSRPVKSCGLVLNRNVTARLALVLSANEVGDLLVLGLLDGALVVLRSLSHELLLDEVDT